MVCIITCEGKTSSKLLTIGPYVRYAPGKLITDEVDALRDIYTGHKNFLKAPLYRELRHQSANSLTMVNKVEHARRRRIISQCVSDVSLRLHEPTIMFHIKKCFDLVTKTDDLVRDDKSQPGWTPARDMADWFNWLTFDIMGDVIFGVTSDLLGNSAKRNIPIAIEESNVRISVLAACPNIRLGGLDRWLFPKAIVARNEFLKFLRDLVERCQSSSDGSCLRNAVSILKSSADPVTGARLSDKEVLAESTTLCIAGADTASTALAAIFYYLSNSVHAYTRASQEVRSIFSSADEIKAGPTLSKLVYVRACINEALRMSPPAGGGLMREVQAGGATVGGRYLPEDIEIGISIYAIHHNPKYYPSPFEYRPERWIESHKHETRQNVDLAYAAFCPFSLGGRSCVGKGMAMLELNLAVAYALFTLDFKLADSENSGLLQGWGIANEFPTKDHIVAAKKGPLLSFKKRSLN